MIPDVELKSLILHKLAKKRKWGESHTAFDNIMKGVPSHLKGRLSELAQELVHEGLLVKKPTSYGVQISLNVNKSDREANRVESTLRVDSSTAKPSILPASQAGE